jgi:putative transposase
MEIKKDAIILKSNGIYPKVSGKGLKFHESLPEFPMDSRLYRLLLHLDQLYSKRAKANTRNKKSLTKAIRRLSAKIKNLIDELHWKTARFLCENFSVILMPTYEIKQMVEKNNRKIRTKTVRSMLGFNNFKFKQRLKWIAKKLGKTVLDVCEAYTSKTHPQTGQVKNIGSAKWIKLQNRSMMTEIW